MPAAPAGTGRHRQAQAGTAAALLAASRRRRGNSTARARAYPGAVPCAAWCLCATPRATPHQEGGLRPGFSETIEVEFNPSQWRYYYDCIRVHVQDGTNLLIPIHGYPVVAEAKVPRNLTFPNSAIGERVTRELPLHCTVPIDFDFHVRVMQDHPYFDISPLQGVVPANGKAFITISYTPLAYCTVSMQFEVLLSQFGAKPIVCNVCGTSKPGVAKEKARLQLTAADPELDALMNTPRPPRHPPTKTLGATTRRRTNKPRPPAAAAAAAKAPLVINDITVPEKRRGVQWVNTVMNQAPSNSNSKAAVAREKFVHARNPLPARKQIEEQFLRQLREEQASAPCLGDDSLPEGERAEILRLREEQADAYHHLNFKGDNARDAALARRRTDTDPVLIRTTRLLDPAGAGAGAADQHNPLITFEPRPGDGLEYRAFVLERFVQGVRKVVIRQRVDTRLERLRVLVDSYKTRVFEESFGQLQQVATGNTSFTTSAEDLAAFTLDTHRVALFKFPNYEVPTILPESAAREKVAVTLPELPAQLPERGSLVVPRQCDLLEYGTIMNPTPFFALFDEESRPLIMNDMVSSFFNEPGGDAAAAEATEPLASTDGGALAPARTAPSDVLNPGSGSGEGGNANGVKVYASMVPYSEVAIDHWLNPFGLAQASPGSVPRKADDHTTAKVFDLVPPSVELVAEAPCASAIALASCRSLSHVWVPRFTDPFLEEILPSQAPAVLTELPADDAMSDDEDDEGDAPVKKLTMADVRSIFACPPKPSHIDDGMGQVPKPGQPRERRTSKMAVVSQSTTAVKSAESSTAAVAHAANHHHHTTTTTTTLRTNAPYGKHGPIHRDTKVHKLDNMLEETRVEFQKDVAKRLDGIQKNFTSYNMSSMS